MYNPVSKAKSSISASGGDPFRAAAGGINKGWIDLKEKVGLSNQAGTDKSNEIRGGIKKEYEDLRGVNTQMDATGKAYGDTMQGVSDTYITNLQSQEQEARGKLTGLRDQASDQATNAQTTYDNSIKPGLLNAVEQSQKELYDPSGNPKYMTYLQAQDPNNAVAQSFRGFYDTQARNEGNQGLADVGIMQNLGAQAMNNQMGGMAGAPMTGSQMQMMQGQNMAQAGQAMANVQRRQQDLRDQGTQQGWLQTQAAYQRGEGARDRQMKNLSSLQSGQGNNLQQQAGLRGEQAGYTEGIRSSRDYENTGTANTQGGMAGLRNQIATGSLQRQAGLISGEAGANRGMDVAALQGINAQQAGKLGFMSGMIGSAGGLAGSFVGGGAGAQAGANASGGGIGGALGAPGAAPGGGGAPQQSYGTNYGNGPGNPGAANLFGSLYGGGGGTNQQQFQPEPQQNGQYGPYQQQGVVGNSNPGYQYGSTYNTQEQGGGIGKIAGLAAMFA